METSNLLRHQIIKDTIAQQPENVADSALLLWRQMAAQIISIIGEGGFNSLYARTLFLCQSTFPWLSVDALPPQTGQCLAELKKNFDGQTPVQIKEANSLLLITFTDILASLIGEALTTSILRSAWGSDALNNPVKE